MLVHAGTIGLLQALLTPLVAVIALGIAFAQWWTARSKLKLDLFERRWRIYEAARTGLLEVRMCGRVSDATRDALVANASAANWLLDEDLTDYLRCSLWSTLMLYAGPRVGEDESQEEQEYWRRSKARWAETELQIIDAKFSRFLKLDESVFGRLTERLRRRKWWLRSA